MNRIIKFAFVFFAVLALLPVSAMSKTYVNGIDANYPPFAYVDGNGKPSGFDVDAMNWIAKKMGFEVEHKPMDWDGIIPALLANKIDMVCSGMSITPERQAVVDFSDPYWNVQKVFVVRINGGPTMQKLLSTKRVVGVQRGTNEHELLEKLLQGGFELEGVKKPNFTLRFYDSAPLAIQDLINGRIDAIGMDSAPAKDAIKNGAKIKMIGEFAPEDQFGVAIRKGDDELRKLINEGYRKLMRDPYWSELVKKYTN